MYSVGIKYPIFRSVRLGYIAIKAEIIRVLDMQYSDALLVMLGKVRLG